MAKTKKEKEEVSEGISFTMKDGSVRTFTEKLHGEDYKEVAKEFATKHASKIVG